MAVMPRWRRSDGPNVVSYRLARQRVLSDVSAGRRQTTEVCDAQPELRRVAHSHSSPIDEPCPMCEGNDLVAVLFAFGPGLPAAGRLVANNTELTRLRRRGRSATCYLVEVCRQCWWNHLRESFDITDKQAEAS